MFAKVFLLPVTGYCSTLTILNCLSVNMIIPARLRFQNEYPGNMILASVSSSPTSTCIIVLGFEVADLEKNVDI